MSITESFITIKLPPTEMYKGMSCDHDPTYNKPCWLSFTYEDAQQYDERVHKYKTKRELKLINLQSLFFHMDFTDKINKKYGGRNEQALLALASIGLPSLKAQQAILTHQPGNCDNPHDKTQIQAEYLNGKHRYSFDIGDAKIDNFLVEELIVFYPQYEGYIIPNEWPSCFHEGNFHKEICIFKPRNALVYIDSNKRIRGGQKQKKSGGVGRCGDEREDISTQQINNIRRNQMRTIGWTGPELYDEDGFLRIPLLEEIERFRFLSIHPSTPKEWIDDLLAYRRSMGQYTPNYDDEYWSTVKYVN